MKTGGIQLQVNFSFFMFCQIIALSASVGGVGGDDSWECAPGNDT